MGKKSKKKTIVESAIKAVVRTPLFRQRIEKSKKIYSRKGHGNSWSEVPNNDYILLT